MTVLQTRLATHLLPSEPIPREFVDMVDLRYPLRHDPLGT